MLASDKKTFYYKLRKGRNAISTSTGYSGGRLYNSRRVTQPLPISKRAALTAPVEYQFALTIKNYDTGEYTLKTPTGTMEPGVVHKIDIKEETKQAIFNQLALYSGMIKAVHLKSMTIEFIPVCDKSTTIGSTLYVKTRYSSTTPTVAEMTQLQPISLIVAGQSRVIQPQIPPLNQQIVAAPELSSTDFANKWTAIPTDYTELDLAIPNLFLLLPAPFGILDEHLEDKSTYIINLKFNIACMKSDVLAELERPSLGKRMWKGVTKFASNGVVQSVAKAAVRAALGA